MTSLLWDKLKKCFYCYTNSSSSSSVKEETKHHNYIQKRNRLKYDGKIEHAFNGIIHELTKEAGGNVDDKEYVKVTSSSKTNSSCAAKNAVDLDNKNNIFHSQNIEGSWIQYDFMKRKVSPTHYTIRSRHNGGKGYYHPKNWVIEGSNDNEKWTILDSQQNVTFLDDRNAFHAFEIKNRENQNESFRFLRMRQTGHKSAGDNYLVLSALEYFGALTDE